MNIQAQDSHIRQNQAQYLFVMSCVALCVTAMTFAIRAGMLNELGHEFSLNKTQLGWMSSMAFIGFPAATVVGGLLYNSLGPKNIMILAFIGHIFGLILTIISGGFWGLLVSTFLIGFANGSVEAACNPMIADMYPENKTKMLNKFHVWFPGGIVVGSLAALLIKRLFAESGPTWQLEIGVMFIPTFIYGAMVFMAVFPENLYKNTARKSTLDNIKSLISPLFIFMCVLMTITATTELGTQQWVGALLENSGANPLIILAIVTGLMAVGRYFAGPLIHAINPMGVLLFSAIVSALGIYLLSISSGSLTYIAAIIFAIGVCYFWPTMVGFVGEYLPQTGALGMSVIGGFGILGLSFWQPIIGRWLDAEKTQALASGLSNEAASLSAGQGTLEKLLLFPIGLIAGFLILFMLEKRGKLLSRETSND